MKRTAIWACAAYVACCWVATSTHAVVVDFDEFNLGDSWGGRWGDSPGHLINPGNPIPVTVEEFFINQFVGFNDATVGGRYVGLVDTTKPLDLNNISARFELSDLPFAVTSVTIDYWYFGGANNLAVNDETIHSVYWLTDLPTTVAAGVTATVTDETITLEGPIDSFQIGGQELNVDNIVVVPEPASLAILAVGAAALVYRRRRRSS
jgi:hypothetical protein